MRKNPCKPDCEGRNATCHSNCDKYLTWHKERTELLEKAHKHRALDGALNEMNARKKRSR